MNAKTVTSQLNNKIRQGPIYKRTKFLKQWRDRWMVLTMNYILIFNSKNINELVQYIDLRLMKSYKSYVRKDDEMSPAGFKIRTNDDMYYFSTKNCEEKWSWIVSIQRLMDFKYHGKSLYNNAEFITRRGFMSQVQFQKGGSETGEKMQLTIQQSQVDDVRLKQKELQRIMVELQQFKQKLNLRQEQLKKKQKCQQEISIIEFNKWKRVEEEMKERQSKLDRKVNQIQRSMKEGMGGGGQREVRQGWGKEIGESSIEVNREEEKKETPTSSPLLKNKDRKCSSRVSQMAKFFQTKIEQSTKVTRMNTTGLGTLKSTSIKAINNQQMANSKQQYLKLCRSKIISNLFEQFNNQTANYQSLRTIAEFMIKIVWDPNWGYQQYFIHQSKTHSNRHFFISILVDIIEKLQSYSQSHYLCKAIEIIIIQEQSAFKKEQLDICKNKLLQIFYHQGREGDVAEVLKCLVVIDQVNILQKDEKFRKELELVVNSGSEESRIWAKKLYERI